MGQSGPPDLLRSTQGLLGAAGSFAPALGQLGAKIGQVQSLLEAINKWQGAARQLRDGKEAPALRQAARGLNLDPAGERPEIRRAQAPGRPR